MNHLDGLPLDARRNLWVCRLKTGFLTGRLPRLFPEKPGKTRFSASDLLPIGCSNGRMLDAAGVRNDNGLGRFLGETAFFAARGLTR